MGLDIVSLLALILAIVLGFVRKSNVGIICMGFAMVLGILYGVKTNDIIKGFSSSLCLQMIGITYLFAIINGNGTLTITANKVVGLVGERHYLVPAVMFLIGYVLCAVGPGAIPMLAIMPVLAVPAGRSAGINPIMTAIIAQCGVMAARMSPITPEAAVVRQLMENQGMVGNTVPIIGALLITNIGISLAAFFYYKGWRVDAKARHQLSEVIPKMNRQQMISLLSLCVLLVGVLFFHWNAGLAGFLVGSFLILLGAGNEKSSVKAVPWNVILMVLGVGILMHILTLSGGINLLIAGLASVMTSGTACSIMAVSAGVLSFFSSGLGVVFPTLVPTVTGIAQSVGSVDPVALVSMVVIGGTVTGLSPVSTTGALIMAAVSQEEAETSEVGTVKFDQNRIFIELFGAAFAALGILAVLAALGVYEMFI